MRTSEHSLEAALARGERGFLPPPRFYYTETFRGLIFEHRCEIDRRLIARPKALRERLLAVRFKSRGRVMGEEAWQPLRTYLDEIEAQMALLLRDHSPAYWLHLYRRISPRLASGHDGKTDDNTVALVRRIAELAFFKHADLACRDDLGSPNRTRLESFLGGHFYRIVADSLGSKLRARKRYDQIRHSPQSVMTRFSEDVLVECFSSERPVDYELAKPGVFAARKSRLCAKIEQAKSLREAVLADPIGTNFDFSWAKKIEWRLVSPFVEFAWEFSDDLFDDEGASRILDVDELLIFLRDGIPPAAALVKYMPRARAEVATRR